METLPWIAAMTAVALLGLAVLGWARLAHRPPRVVALPTEWGVSARPVFSTYERRFYKLLRDSLPQHVVLSKLPLVRFCQPNDPSEVRFWYELLGAIHVTFAVCSANGRVLAAVDLEGDRNNSRRILQIKQSVLGACRVRYLRCPVDNPPSAAELQMLVQAAGGAGRVVQPMPTPDLAEARDSLASTVAIRRAQRSALWQDSSRFQDSFFAPDSRFDGFGHGEVVAPSAEAAAAAALPGQALDDSARSARTAAIEEAGAVVSEAAASVGSRSRH
jgi:hypothetical protein